MRETLVQKILKLAERSHVWRQKKCPDGKEENALQKRQEKPGETEQQKRPPAHDPRSSPDVMIHDSLPLCSHSTRPAGFCPSARGIAFPGFMVCFAQEKKR
ncbi:MAG: hypothetical protein AB7T27_02610 [Kiritimatiellia bacterium]